MSRPRPPPPPPPPPLPQSPPPTFPRPYAPRALPPAGPRPPFNPALGRRSPCPPVRAAQRTSATNQDKRPAGDPVPGSRSRTTPLQAALAGAPAGDPVRRATRTEARAAEPPGHRARKGSRRDPVPRAPTATQPTVERNDGRRHHHQPLQQPAFKRVSQWGRFLN